MGMRYSVNFDAVAVTAQSDLFEINAPADCIVLIRSVYIGQTSDMGDAAAEALKIQFITGHATSGSGGSAMTPTKLETGFAAAGSSCEVNNTTIASTGTAVVKHQDVWNVQLPYQYRPMPEEMIVLSPSERLVVRMPAPADSLTVSGSMIIEEIGG